LHHVAANGGLKVMAMERFAESVDHGEDLLSLRPWSRLGAHADLLLPPEDSREWSLNHSRERLTAGDRAGRAPARTEGLALGPDAPRLPNRGELKWRARDGLGLAV
jgi:hypothetical protein